MFERGPPLQAAEEAEEVFKASVKLVLTTVRGQSEYVVRATGSTHDGALAALEGVAMREVAYRQATGVAVEGFREMVVEGE